MQRSKMASTQEFSSQIDLPAELLQIFEASNITLETLVHISRDELIGALQSNEAEWNVDEIFRRITEWRRTNGYDLLTFSEVYIEEWNGSLEGEEIYTEPSTETVKNIATTPYPGSEIITEECTTTDSFAAGHIKAERESILQDGSLGHETVGIENQPALCNTPAPIAALSCPVASEIIDIKANFHNHPEYKATDISSEANFIHRNTSVLVGDLSHSQSSENHKAQYVPRQILAPVGKPSCSRSTDKIPLVDPNNTGFQNQSVLRIIPVPVTQSSCSTGAVDTNLQNYQETESIDTVNVLQSVPPNTLAPEEEPSCSRQTTKLQNRPDFQNQLNLKTCGNDIQAQIVPRSKPALVGSLSSVRPTVLTEIGTNIQAHPRLRTVEIVNEVRSAPRSTVASVEEIDHPRSTETIENTPGFQSKLIVEDSGIANSNRITGGLVPSRSTSEPTEEPNAFKSTEQVCQTNKIKAVQRFSVDILVQILNKTVTGKDILKRGDRGPLSNESQRELVAIIADYHNTLGIAIKEEILRDYGEAIVARFRQETLDTYFIPRSGRRKNHGGKLYNRITNLKQKISKRANREEEHLQGKKPKVDETVVRNAAVEAAKLWLERNSRPWSTVLDKWIESFEDRKPRLLNSNNVDEILAKQRHYSDEHGYQIVEIDFKLLKLGEDNCINKWNHLLPKIIRYLDQPFKDDVSVTLLNLIKSPDTNKDSTISAVLILLNNVLKPTKVTKTYKPSILSAQEDIIFFAESDHQVVQKINDFNATYESLGFQSVPKLVFRGKDVTSLSGRYEVHYKSIVYTLDTAERAIDVLVKLSSVFGLEYSRICRLVWYFICSFIYNIAVPEQYECINKLKRFLSQQ
ncbi:uncharacterized protein LOC134228112 [Armigeres subalbatus]|uniref:uncharacterized protein LOC134228112 n=1 Tax=Armigeres subalbatus TaxID=124917 RepID=UPI002ED35F35